MSILRTHTTLKLFPAVHIKIKYNNWHAILYYDPVLIFIGLNKLLVNCIIVCLIFWCRKPNVLLHKEKLICIVYSVVWLGVWHEFHMRFCIIYWDFAEDLDQSFFVKVKCTDNEISLITLLLLLLFFYLFIIST